MVRVMLVLAVLAAAQSLFVVAVKRPRRSSFMARLRKAARRLAVPAHGVSRAMFLLPVGLLGQVSGSPTAPPSGAKLMQDALNWALWVGLILSGLAAAGGAGAIGVSRVSGQMNHTNTGKQVLMGGLIGAAGVGIAIPAVNMLFTAAKG